MNDVHGVIHIHSCPLALVPQIEWTLTHVVSSLAEVEWVQQTIEPGAVRATVSWAGGSGIAARFASALRGWEQTRFEVWESTGINRDGVRYVHTPDLGIFYTLTDAAGNAVVGEDRLRYALDMADGDIVELERELSLALGEPWDTELEPYRRAAADHIVPLRRKTSVV
jgi:hypothetical protein